MQRAEGNSLGSVLLSYLLQRLWDRTLSLTHILSFWVPKFSCCTYARQNFQRLPKDSSIQVLMSLPWPEFELSGLRLQELLSHVGSLRSYEVWSVARTKLSTLVTLASFALFVYSVVIFLSANSNSIFPASLPKLSTHLTGYSKIEKGKKTGEEQACRRPKNSIT